MFKKSCDKASELMLKWAPPWLKIFKEKHPRWFWAFVAFLVILPMGVTAFIASQAIWVMFTWMFAATK